MLLQMLRNISADVRNVNPYPFAGLLSLPFRSCITVGLFLVDIEVEELITVGDFKRRLK